MTPAERKDPKLVDVGRKQRIAAGAGLQAKQVSDLIKQYDMMKPMLTGMAGMGAGDRMQQIQDLQRQMMNPGGKMPGVSNKGASKRLTPKQKKKLAKEREKLLRQRRREKKNQGDG